MQLKPGSAAALCVALLVAAAAAQCAPGQVAPGCSSCAGQTYTYGGSPRACASCVGGATFLSSAQGCSAPPGALPSLANTVLSIPGDLQSLSALTVTGAPTNSIDVNGVGGSAIALTAAGQALSTAPMSALPTGGKPRALAAWVKCPLQANANGNSAVVLELGDASGGPLVEQFSLRATNIHEHQPPR